MKTCIPEEIAQQLADSLRNGTLSPDQITKMLPEEREAVRAILENVVSDELGIKVSGEEIAEIKKMSETIEAAQEKLGSNLGNPSFEKENLDFFKAKQQMDNYLQSQVPSSRLKVATGTIARGAMLFSVKSPLFNAISNMEGGFTEAIARRVATGKLVGANNELAIDYVKFVNKVYQETGYDISRMTSIDEDVIGGDTLKGNTVSAQGPGTVRKVGRIVEDTVFKQLMGAPDVMFSAAHFADSVNLSSMRLADGNKQLATEYMKDAMKLKPETPEGEILRANAILDAQTATWTNTTWASKVSSGIRGIINEVSGDLRIGDFLLPFIKTPANVIATGMDYAGLGFIKSGVKAFQAFKKGDIKDPIVVQNILKSSVRAGVGLTLAYLLTTFLSDDDFVGAYDPKRSQIEQLRNSNYNAVKLGDKWYSVDWFGPLAIPITAMMTARKYGKGFPEKVFQYGKGVLMSATSIPGIKDIVDTSVAYKYQKNTGINELSGSLLNYVAKEVVGRFVPAISADVAKVLDPVVRDTTKSFYGPLLAKIPFASKTLPAKKNVFGEDVQGEGPLSDILFGSRLKTDRSDATINEVSKVAESLDKGISFTDWNKSSSKQLEQFKTKIGDKRFEQAKEQYGKEIKKQLDELVNKPAYKRLTDEGKLKAITAQDTDAMETVFKKFGFKYKREKSVKTSKL